MTANRLANLQGRTMQLLRIPLILSTLLLATIISPLASADFLGLYAGGGAWQAKPQGEVGRSNINLNSTLNLDEESNRFVYIALEHPIPLIPNIRLQHTEMDWVGNALISAGTDLNGSPFLATEQADVTLNLTHTDATFYYEILDNVVDLDLGITARVFDGDASLASPSQQEAIDLGATVPMIYGKAGIDIPFTIISGALVANWVNVDDFRLIDWSAEVTFEMDLAPAVDAGLVLGYRSLQVEIDDFEELQSDARFEGYFVALQLHF
jgi:outer membrane protein